MSEAQGRLESSRVKEGPHHAVLKGETDGALKRRAWVLKTEGNACSKEDAALHNTWFWKFDQVPRFLPDTGVRVPA